MLLSPKKANCIFIHGNSSSEVLWRPFQKELAKVFDFSPLNVSYPSDNSIKAPIWTKSNLVDDILSNISEDFKKDPIIFGHSLGGHLAVELALKLPSIKGLVLLQCSPSQNIEMLSGFFDQKSLTSTCMFKEKWSTSEFKTICDELSYPHPPTNEFLENLKMNNEKLRKDLGSSLAIDGLENEWELLNNINAHKELILFDSDPVMKIHKIKKELDDLGSLNVSISKARGHYGLYYEPEVLCQELQSLILKIK